MEIHLSGEDKRAGHYFYGFGAPICFILNVTLNLAIHVIVNIIYSIWRFSLLDADFGAGMEVMDR